MKKLALISFVLILGYLSPTTAQSGGEKLVRTKPSIFLSFERNGLYESPCGEERVAGIWLRLSNNTLRAIYIDGSPVSKDGRDNISIKLSDGNEVRGVKADTEMRVRYDYETVGASTTRVKGNNVELLSPITLPLPRQNKHCSQKWMGIGNNGYWLASGSSILFSIPEGALNEKLKISVQYVYEWETTSGRLSNFEPQHFVYFYGVDLPSR